MHSDLADIFGSARQVSLTGAERAAGREALAMAMKAGVSAADEAALFAPARGVAMDAEERSAVRERLSAYMRLTPPAHAAARAPRLGDGLAEFLFDLSFRRAPAALAAVVLLAGSGTAMAAASESALPGDFLYPVKVGVAEQPYLRLRFDAAARAEWEAVRAERRILEAEALLENGRMTDETRTDIARRIQMHSRRAETVYPSGGAAGVDKKLREHEKALRALLDDRTEAEVQVRVLLDRVARANEEVKKEAAAGSSGHAASLAVGITAKEDAERQVDGAVRRLEQVRQEIVGAAGLDAASVRTAQERLTQATSLLSQAQAKTAAGAYDEAVALAKRASLLAQEAKLLTRAAGDLQIDLTPDREDAAASAQQVRGKRKVMMLRRGE